MSGESTEAVNPTRRRRSAKYQTPETSSSAEVMAGSESGLSTTQAGETHGGQTVQKAGMTADRVSTNETSRFGTERNRKQSTEEPRERRHSAGGTRGYVPERLEPKTLEEQKAQQAAKPMVRDQGASGTFSGIPVNPGFGYTSGMTRSGMQNTAGRYPTASGPVTTGGQTGRMPQMTGPSGRIPYVDRNAMTHGGNGNMSRTGMSSGAIPPVPYGGMSSSGQQPVRNTGGYVSQTNPRMSQTGTGNPGYTPGQGYPPVSWNTMQHGSGAVPPVPPQQNTGGQSAAAPSPKKGKPGKSQKVLRYILIACILAALLFAGYRILTNIQAERALRESVEAYDNRFVDGVYVDGIALGGMTYDEALLRVRENAQKRSDAWSVELTYQGQLVQRISASDLNITVDVQETMNNAWKAGHVGTIEERRAEMDQLLETPYEAYTANPGGDQSKLKQILQNLQNKVYRAPKNAEIASFNAGLTYPFTFNEEEVGRSLDLDALQKAIYQSLSTMESESVELNIIETQPEITVDWIKENLLEERGFGSTPITSHSTDNRNENIRVAFSKIAGTVLQPGDTFSFNDIVGQRTEKNGFLPAIEYAYGEVSDGIGGGVCQASTTVYLAAVRAGLQIVKREPHSDAVNYIEYGKDATVYWYSNHKIDLVFRNNTEHPIYITAAVQSDKRQRTKLVCNVRMYGESLHGVTYDIVTEETVIEPPEPTIEPDRKGEYVTYTDEQKVIREASKGCEVKSFRVAYKDGVEIERKPLYTDTYKAKPQIIKVGVTPR